MTTLIKLFFSYAHEDREQVKGIYQRLQVGRYKPWMDTYDLFGGERWERAIFRALKEADFVLIFLSPRAYKRGFLQREIRKALYFAEEKLETDIYIIPVKLEECEIQEPLNEYHWVHLFDEDGWGKLMNAIRAGLERRNRKKRSRDR